ncbi:MAG: hypothetical protein WAK29_04245 [Terriglobales bacterium]
MKPFLLECGGGAPVREAPAPGTANRIARSFFRAIMESLAIAIAILQEIFDESAYQRFLQRSRLPSSPRAYALFQQENNLAKSRRPRCC